MTYQDDYERSRNNQWDRRATNSAAENIARAGAQHQPPRAPQPYSIHFQPTYPQNVQQPQQPYLSQSGTQPSTYMPGPGTNAAFQVQFRLQAALLAWLGYRAGRNSYELHADWVKAAEHGAHAMRRWWFWLFFIKVWLLQALFVCWLYSMKYHDAHTSAANAVILSDGEDMLQGYITNGHIFIPLGFVLILVAYCRAIDFGLHRRSFVYWLVRPVSLLLIWMPNFVLYTLMLWVPLFGWIH